MDTKRIVVTGCGGLLGGNLCYVLRDKNLVGMYHRTPPSVPIRQKESVNIADEKQVKRILSASRPDLIIHCAGLTGVDECEKDYHRAHQVNAVGTLNLVRQMKKGCRFIYISTDAIFDGEKGNYTEDDTPEPLNNYAKTKSEGERFVRELTDDYLVIRTNFYGLAPPQRVGFIQWILRELSAGRNIRMAKDWYYSPILVNELIDGIVMLVNTDARGTYNISSSGGCSKYEFAMSVAEEMGLDTGLISPVLLSDLNLFARRPPNMTLDNGRIRAAYPVRLSGYREGITKFRGLVESGYGNGYLFSFAPQ